MSRVAAGLLLVLAACTPAGVPPAATAPATPSVAPPAPARTIPPASPPSSTFRTVDCDAPPRDFALLCDSYRLVTAHYLRPLDRSALAAAALAGVAVSTPEVAVTETPFVCALPDPSFEAVCDAIAVRVRTEGASAASLVTAAVDGLFRFGLDPFSGYVPPEIARSTDATAPGRVPSLGITVATRTVDGAPCRVIDDRCHLEVVAVGDFAPGSIAGILVGDVIERIDGTSVTGQTLFDAVGRLAGPVSSSVDVELRRGQHRVAKILVRDYVPTAYVEWDIVAPDTAWIHLADFSQKAAQELGSVLASDDLGGTNRLVLDLRGNPGGLLPAAQAVVSQFLGDGTAFVVEGADGTVRVPVLAGGLATDTRLVILVDRGTASAAEIVAAALQEAGRAAVVGERTFGKSLVQRVFPLSNGGEAHISIAEWATAGGATVGVGGLVPDVAVGPPTEDDPDPAFAEALRRLGR